MPFVRDQPGRYRPASAFAAMAECQSGISWPAQPVKGVPLFSKRGALPLSVLGAMVPAGADFAGEPPGLAPTGAALNRKFTPARRGLIKYGQSRRQADCNAAARPSVRDPPGSLPAPAAG